MEYDPELVSGMSLSVTRSGAAMHRVAKCWVA